jgi:metal-responsive CopG/Arc/MetJ family transcriptional regulator
MWNRIATRIHIQRHEVQDVKTVQMTLDESLVREVDREVKRLGTTRSAFARQALREAVQRIRVRDLERRHREGYSRWPVTRQELAVWEGEQVWPEDE